MTSRELDHYDEMIIDKFIDDRENYVKATRLATNVYRLSLLVRDLRQITEDSLNCRDLNRTTSEIYEVLDKQIDKALDEEFRLKSTLNSMLREEK